MPIFVKFNDQKLVLGTLSAEKCSQISYDLVFEKEFELSHGSKNASVYFCGYKSLQLEEEYPFLFYFLYSVFLFVKKIENRFFFRLYVFSLVPLTLFGVCTISDDDMFGEYLAWVLSFSYCIIASHHIIILVN